MDDDQKRTIKASVGKLIEKLARDLDAYPEAVADVAFLYIQKHPSWGRNPTRTQKQASYEKWGGQCQKCNRAIEFEEAVFHHLARRIPNQHGPENLLPYHPPCHDKKHDVVEGSLSKGAPQSRK